MRWKKLLKKREGIFINIFNKEGQKILSSHKIIHKDLPRLHQPQEFIRPILEGREKEIITHQILRAHKGRIEVESEINAGISFRIYLPNGGDDLC